VLTLGVSLLIGIVVGVGSLPGCFVGLLSSALARSDGFLLGILGSLEPILSGSHRTGSLSGSGFGSLRSSLGGSVGRIRHEGSALTRGET